ncbi:MAG: type II secretion system protein [Candidatus Hydrothermia bacterium]
MFPISKSKRRGLTLIEISVVLIIFGLFVAVSVPVTMAISRRSKIIQAESELKGIREAILNFFIVNGYLPPPDPGYTIPVSMLGLPNEYKYDPITGKPYFYFPDDQDPADTIKIDGIPMGFTSAVIISAGVNGKFDLQDTSSRNFTSVGSGDFDDILYYISELDLKGLFAQGIPSGSYKPCDSHQLTIYNRSTSTVYLRYLYPGFTSTTNTITANSVVTISNIPRNATVQISTENLFNDNRSTIAFNIASFNEGTCEVGTGIFFAVDNRAIYITQDILR